MNRLRSSLIFKFIVSIFLFSVFLTGNTTAQKCGVYMGYNSINGSSEKNEEKVNLNHNHNFKNNLESTFKNHTDTILYIIPVVFHVIHNGGSENISNSKIFEALDILNQDFSRTNPDRFDGPEQFLSLAGNPKIEFRLARIDPEGNCTVGVNRLQSPISELAELSGELRETIYWPKEKYLNIWVVKQVTDAGIVFGGWGKFPAFGEGDGIVINANELGMQSYPNNLPYHGYFSDSRLSGKENVHLLTHEVGHWLNLFHTWGNINESCILDDFVEDTPLQFGPTIEDCPIFPVISCDNGPNGNMFNNFMDYSSCTNMFTHGQVGRMWNTLNISIGGRDLIHLEDNLKATGVSENRNTTCGNAPIAEFGWGERSKYGIYCRGEDVPFFDASGSDKIDAWRWTFEGGTPQFSEEKNPFIKYDSSGIYNVQLTVYNEFGVDTINRKIKITVLQNKIHQINSHILENFEDPTGSNNLVTFSSTPDTTWTISESYSAGTGSNSLYLHNSRNLFETKIGSLDGFITPRYRLENFQRGNLSFRIAYRNRNVGRVTNLPTTLSISIIDECNSLGAKVIANLPPDSLNTRTFFGFPDDSSHWKKVTIPIESNLIKDNAVRFAFTLMHMDGADRMDIFIDDLMFEPNDQTTSVYYKSFSSNWSIYPNPSRDKFTIAFDPLNEGVKLKLIDLSGQVRIQRTIQNRIENIDIPNITAGIYYVMLESKNMVGIKKLIVID